MVISLMYKKNKINVISIKYLPLDVSDATNDIHKTYE